MDYAHMNVGLTVRTVCSFLHVIVIVIVVCLEVLNFTSVSDT